VLEVEDTGLAAADSLDREEEAEHSLVAADCYSLAEGTAAFAVWPTFALWSRTAGFPAATQSPSPANDGDSTGNRHNNSKPRWI